MTCTTHHYACECREAAQAERRHALADALRSALMLADMPGGTPEGAVVILATAINDAIEELRK